MAKKKTITKVTDEQVKAASESLAGVPGKTVPPPKASKTPVWGKKSEKTKTPAPKLPDFLHDDISKYVVGTEDYRKLVEDFNKRNATAYNPWRVRPAVLYTIWYEQRMYYMEK